MDQSLPHHQHRLLVCRPVLPASPLCLPRTKRRFRQQRKIQPHGTQAVSRHHGPRNDLPKGYAPKEVIRMLNEVKEELLCVRGNCEADVDQMVLEFPVMADYCVLQLEDTGVVFASHGHVHNPQCMPPLKNGDILLNGHTHVPACEKIADENGNEYMYLNPGSVSIPKEGSSHSYMVYEKGTFTWKNMSGEVYREWKKDSRF